MNLEYRLFDLTLRNDKKGLSVNSSVGLGASDAVDGAGSIWLMRGGDHATVFIVEPRLIPKK